MPFAFWSNLFPDNYFTAPSLQRELWHIWRMGNQIATKFKTFNLFFKSQLVNTKIFSYWNPLGDVYIQKEM